MSNDNNLSDSSISNDALNENITIKEKLGFAVGDTASGLIFQMSMFYLLYFYTDVFGIPAEIVATMFVITKIWDSINDPLMGIIADRTKTKWGKFRPYILWLAIPFGIVGVLNFTTPDLGLQGKIIYAYVTYSLTMMVYTAINIPYSSLMGVISASPLQRTSFAQYRFAMAFTGALLVQGLTLPLVATIGGNNTDIFSAELSQNHIVIKENGTGASKLVINADIGKDDPLVEKRSVVIYKAEFENEIDTTTSIIYLKQGFGTQTFDTKEFFKEDISSANMTVEVINEAKGFQGTMIVYGILAVLLFYITFFTTKERVAPPKEQKTNVKNDIKDLFNNGPWLLLVGVGVVSLTYVVIRGGVVMYYFKYFIENEMLASAFLVSGTILTIISVLLTERFTKKFGNKRVFIASQLIAGTFTALFFFVDKSNLVMIFALQLIVSFASGPPAPILFSMYTDCASYSEWKNKRRATGLVMSASTMAQKFGLTIGAALTGYLLAAYGFKANVTQSEDALTIIVLMISLIPAAGSFIVAGLMSFYKLDNKTMENIEKELQARRVEAG